MLSYVLATIRDNNEILAYKILTIANGRSVVNDVPRDMCIQICQKNKVNFQNAEYIQGSNELKGLGANINTLPIFDAQGILKSYGGLTLLYGITQGKDGDTIGYGVADSYGMVVNIPTQKLISLSSAYKLSNFEIYTKKSGDLGFRLKHGNLVKIKMETFNKQVRAYNSKIDSQDKINEVRREQELNKVELVLNNAQTALETAEHKNDLSSQLKSSGSDNALPGLHVYNLNDVSKLEVNASCQNKLFITAISLSAVSPYYHLMYQSIPKKPVTAIPTMGVTEDQLFYNPGFVNSLSVPELTFVMIHEMLHIAMQHTIRHGNRDNKLWNIACDLFINELIMRDFGCQYGGTEVAYRAKDEKGKERNGSIKVPMIGVFLATIGETLDFGVDTPESIYRRLVEENPPQQSKGGSQGGSGSQSSGMSGNGASGSGGEADADSEGDSGNGNGEEQDNQQDQGSDGGNGEKNPFEGVGNSGMENSTISVEIVDSDNGEYNEKAVEVEVTYKGKKIRGLVPMDVTSNNECKATSADVKKALDESQMALQRIITKKKMAESEGKDCSLTSSSAVCERYIRFGLSARYDWVQILKNVAKVDPKKMYTLAQPNKQYFMRGITLASRRELGRPEKIRGIKFAMDVSGSVTQKEMDSIFTKISQILDLFKIDAELIYWDTSVNSVGDFNDLKGLKSIKPLGGGGTDLTCVFDYLLGKTRCNGHKEETPLKDISLVMIFTDGCFGIRNPEQYKKFFGNKTVFVANDGCAPFDIPFGKLAVSRDGNNKRK